MGNIGILEITDTAVRLLVGQYANDEVSIVFTKELPIEGYIERGEVKSVDQILDVIKSLAKLKDDEANVNLQLNRIALVLPPIGFKIFETRKSTNTVSSTMKILPMDIENVLSLAQKDLTNPGFEVVDVVPQLFFLGQDKYTKIPPLGEESRTLAIIARIFALPSSLISTYVRRIVEPSGLSLTKSIVSTVAIEEVCKKALPSIPNHYLVDIGEGYTKVALVGSNCPVSSGTFPKGTMDLIKMISSRFNIPFAKARELLEVYGIEDRHTKFMPPIIESINEEGLKSVYTLDELSNIIKEFFVEFFNDLDVCVLSVQKGFEPSKVNGLPFILTGGVTAMKGLSQLFKTRYPSVMIHNLKSNILGAREQKYIPLIGALLYSATYKGCLTDSNNNVTPLDREEEVKDEKKKTGLRAFFGGNK